MSIVPGDHNSPIIKPLPTSTTSNTKYKIKNANYTSKFMKPENGTASSAGDDIQSQASDDNDSLKYVLAYVDSTKGVARIQCKNPSKYVSVSDKTSGTNLTLSDSIFDWTLIADGDSNEYYVTCKSDKGTTLYAHLDDDTAGTNIALSTTKEKKGRWIFSSVSDK